MTTNSLKIGFLAMSGVRAHDPELLELGLTLPGFVDRSKVIASLPSLGLLYLAACTPDGHELHYFDAEADGSEPTEVYTCDLVAISTFSAQVFEAYAIADRLRAAGVKVAMGGLHVSVMPDEATAHADYVVVGEGENVWPDVVRAAISDCEGASESDNHEAHSSPRAAARGSEPGADAGVRDCESREQAQPTHGQQPVGLKDVKRSGRIFRAEDYPPVDVAALPVPRYDLLGQRPYNRYTVQTTRGCPWRCDFCASTVMLQRPYRKRPVEHVIRDIRAIAALYPQPFIEFADDNTFVDKKWGKALCRQLAPLGLKWFTETDISVADDPELLDLMAAAGCRQVLIGPESPTAAGLSGIEQRKDFKRQRAADYADAIRRIQRAGITVNGCFVLGLDGHTPEVFPQILDFSLELGLYDVQITYLTAFPGTPLHDRLLAAGRIPQPGRWDLCTLFDINYEPTHMTRDELRAGMFWLGEHLYSDDFTRKRRRRFFRDLRAAARDTGRPGLTGRTERLPA